MVEPIVIAAVLIIFFGGLVCALAFRKVKKYLGKSEDGSWPFESDD